MQTLVLSRIGVCIVLASLVPVGAACGHGTRSDPAPPSATSSSSSSSPASRIDAEAELEQTTRNVLIANRPRLRACYEDALAKTPDLEGKVVLVIDVGQNGRAAHVLEGRREGLTDDVVRCLARVVKTIAFHDGAARTVRVQVPLSFSKRDEP